MQDDLRAIRVCLQARTDLRIVLRGSGVSSFLYIRSSHRAAEVSVEGKEFFVEYWDSADDNSHVPPIKSETLPSISSTTDTLTEWFLTGSSRKISIALIIGPVSAIA